MLGLLNAGAGRGFGVPFPALGAEGGAKTKENRELLILARFAANAGPVSPLFHRAACWEM